MNILDDMMNKIELTIDIQKLFSSIIYSKRLPESPRIVYPKESFDETLLETFYQFPPIVK